MAKVRNWDKAKRAHDKEQERKRPRGKSRRALQAAEDKQQAMALFVFKHRIECFKCRKSENVRWAKTGFSKRGPWAICMDCVKR